MMSESLKKKLSLQIDVSADDFKPADKQEQLDLIQFTKNTSYWKDAWRRLKKNKIAMIALCVIILFILFAFVGPLLSPYTYDQQIRGDENMAPCWKHPFGTDLWSRFISPRYDRLEFLDYRYRCLNRIGDGSLTGNSGLPAEFPYYDENCRNYLFCT